MHDCLYCSDRYCAKDLEDHHKVSHREHFEFTFCRICSNEYRTDIFESHVRGDNIYGDGEYIKKLELDKLFETNSYGNVVTALLKKIKLNLDFDSKFSDGISRGCRFCGICRYPFVRDCFFDEHLRSHNKYDDSYYIDPSKVETMLEDVSYHGITKALTVGALCIKCLIIN